MVKKIVDSIKSFFGESCYAIGFLTGYEVLHNVLKSKVEWVKGIAKDRWYADPFILYVDEDIIELLVERFKYKEAKGVLCRIEIDRKSNTILNETTILELPTHLSFPFIFEEEGKIYVMPENYQSGSLYIYEYDRDNDSLVNPKMLIDEPLLDAVCEKIDGKYYIFAVKYEDSWYRRNAILYIYSSQTLLGEYKLQQTIEYNKEVARGAGAIIEIGNRYIRPSQDCQGGYGKSVIFSELSICDGEFVFEECRRLLPLDIRFSEGLHTYNQKNGLIVIDGMGYRRGLLANLLSVIYKKIKKC